MHAGEHDEFEPATISLQYQAAMLQQFEYKSLSLLIYTIF